MKPKLCKKCGREIPADAVLCPYCAELVKQNDTETKAEPESEDIFAEFSYQPQKKSSNIGCLTFASIILLFVCIIMPLKKALDSKDEYEPYSNTSGYSTSTSSSSYSQNSYSTPTPTPNNGKSSDKIETAVNALMKSMEEQGYICSRSGYSFEQCVKAAKDYGISFNQNASFMAFVDIQTYFLCGFTTDGRNFCAEISHDKVQDNVWSVENVDYYIMN